MGCLASIKTLNLFFRDHQLAILLAFLAFEVATSSASPTGMSVFIDGFLPSYGIRSRPFRTTKQGLILTNVHYERLRSQPRTPLLQSSLRRHRLHQPHLHLLHHHRSSHGQNSPSSHKNPRQPLLERLHGPHQYRRLHHLHRRHHRPLHGPVAICPHCSVEWNPLLHPWSGDHPRRRHCKGVDRGHGLR